MHIKSKALLERESEQCNENKYHQIHKHNDYIDV